MPFFVLLTRGCDSANSIAMRMLRAIGRDDLADNPTLAANPGRIKRLEECDSTITGWIAEHTQDEVLDRFLDYEVVAGPIGIMAKVRTRRPRADPVNAVVACLGASLSDEHGPGQLKRDEIRQRESALEMELMHRIKDAIDPQALMNPGNFFVGLLPFFPQSPCWKRPSGRIAAIGRDPGRHGRPARHRLGRHAPRAECGPHGGRLRAGFGQGGRMNGDQKLAQPRPPPVVDRARERGQHMSQSQLR